MDPQSEVSKYDTNLHIYSEVTYLKLSASCLILCALTRGLLVGSLGQFEHSRRLRADGRSLSKLMARDSWEGWVDRYSKSALASPSYTSAACCKRELLWKITPMKRLILYGFNDATLATHYIHHSKIGLCRETCFPFIDHRCTLHKSKSAKQFF